MSLIPKFLTREDMFQCTPEQSQQIMISPITATLLYHWTLPNDTTFVLSADDLSKPEALLFGAFPTDGGCTATDVAQAG
jgi:hypothetical protein